MTNRESVSCPFCGAQSSEPCEFNGKPAPEVNDNGVLRRSVHAARYAATLIEAERKDFWASAVDRYITEEMKIMPVQEGQ